MFDFLRNLTKSNEEKAQEKLSAYLDNGLAPQERLAFEEAMGADAALLASVEQQRLIKQNLSALPMMRAPRNFTLDPALYGRPTPQAFFKLYPALRTATALAAVALILLFSLELFSSAGVQADTLAQAPMATAVE
jgi:anti-sigma factor RsiW